MDEGRKKKIRYVPLSMHWGESFKMAASTYPSIPKTIVEMVQNGIDAGAKTVVVAVDQKRSLITVADDGAGVTVETFNEALKSVARTIKHQPIRRTKKSATPEEKRRVQMGQFGRGLISPLDKCRAFRLTSRPEGQDEITSWLFVGEQIMNTEQDITIPEMDVDEMPTFNTPFKTRTRNLGAEWRTVIELDGVTADKVVRAINKDELVRMIRTNLRAGMIANRTTVHLLISDDGVNVDHRRVNAMVFTGEALPIVEDIGDKVGLVRFEMYRANKNRSGNRDGIVMFGRAGSASQIPLNKKFLMQAVGSRSYAPYAEAFKALSSGYFEGLITGEHLNLQPERDDFVSDEVLRDFHLAIGVWYEYHGRQHVETEQENRRDERWHQLSLKSLEMLISSAVDDQRLSATLDMLEGTRPNPTPKPRNPDGKDPAPSPPRPPRPPHVIRTKPRDATDGTGKKGPAKLQFALEQRESDDLWDFDFATATIVFNTLHGTWTKLDDTHGKRTEKNDDMVVHLQFCVGVEVLLHLGQHSDPESFEATRHEMDARIKCYAEHIIPKMH